MKLRPPRLFSRIAFWLLVTFAFVGASRRADAQERGEEVAVPRICSDAEAITILTSMLSFCHEGNCFSSLRARQILEDQMNRAALDRISTTTDLHPVRVFYLNSRQMFREEQLVSARHFRAVSESLRRLAQEYARIHPDNPDATIVVLGRASSVGGDEFNRVLSHYRARSIVDYLNTVYNVPMGSLKIAYFGSELFQLSASRLAEFGLTDAEIRRGGRSDNDLEEQPLSVLADRVANQSAVAFLFPCRRAASGAVAGDGGAPRPPGAQPPSQAEHHSAPDPSECCCVSRWGQPSSGEVTEVYLLGAPAREAFDEYIRALGPGYGGRDLSKLVVHHATVPRLPTQPVEWFDVASPVGLIERNPVGAWRRALQGRDATAACLPRAAQRREVDVFCMESRPRHPPDASEGNDGNARRTPYSLYAGYVAICILAVLGLTKLVSAIRRAP